MKSSDFLSHEQFERLTEEQQLEYVTTLADAVKSWPTPGVDAAELVSNWAALLSWVLPPDEYEQKIGRLLWNGVWENAEGLAERLESAVANLDASEDQRRTWREHAEELRAMVQHRETLGGLPDTPERE
jgi:hypothetical protein